MVRPANASLPYLNKSLKNLKGEKWKEIEEMGGYYQISSYGHIKSLPRLIEVYIPSRKISITWYTKERILAIKVHEKINTIVNEPYYECTVSLN